MGTDLVQVKGCSSSGGGTMWSRMHAPKLKVVASALAAAPHRSRTSHRAPPYPSRHAQPPSTQQPAWHLDAHGKHHVDDFEGSYCSSEPARAVVVHVWEPNGSLAAQQPMVYWPRRMLDHAAARLGGAGELVKQPAAAAAGRWPHEGQRHDHQGSVAAAAVGSYLVRVRVRVRVRARVRVRPSYGWLSPGLR
eukprot:scaffold19911_cov59-Phaeocystis_antarctica.AAC.3